MRQPQSVTCLLAQRWGFDFSLLGKVWSRASRSGHTARRETECGTEWLGEIRRPVDAVAVWRWPRDTCITCPELTKFKMRTAVGARFAPSQQFNMVAALGAPVSPMLFVICAEMADRGCGQ